MRRKKNPVPFLTGMIVGGTAGMFFLLVYWLTVYREIFH